MSIERITGDTPKMHAGESKEHKEGKLWVRDQLEERGLEAELEFPVGNRRADVVEMHPSGDMIAHEIQLSSISVPKIRERMEDYWSRGVEGRWYFGKGPSRRVKEWCVFNEVPCWDFRNSGAVVRLGKWERKDIVEAKTPPKKIRGWPYVEPRRDWEELGKLGVLARWCMWQFDHSFGLPDEERFWIGVLHAAGRIIASETPYRYTTFGEREMDLWRGEKHQHFTLEEGLVIEQRVKGEKVGEAEIRLGKDPCGLLVELVEKWVV